MKPLITFLALMMLFMECFSYAGDYQLYVHELNSLKEAASECAASAALSLDYDEYAKGRVVFDRPAAEEAAARYFEYYLERISRVPVVSSEIILEFEDERNTGIINPIVKVTLTLDTEDLFRNKSLTVTQLCRSSTYELKVEQEY